MTPYEILGVPVSATAEQIETAYKRLAMTWHPDRCTDPEVKPSWHARFLDIKEAYEVLIDDARRKAFDAGESTGSNRDEAEALNLLRGAIQRAAVDWLGYIMKGISNESRPLLPMVATQLRAERTGHLNKQKAGAKELGHLRALAKRQRRKKGTGRNIVVEMTDHYLMEVTEVMTEVERQLRLVDRATAILEDYDEDAVAAEAAAIQISQARYITFGP